MGRFFQELRRRKIFQVAGVYAVTGWLVAQAIALVVATYGAPAWVQPTAVTIILAGFPIAVVLAWAFEVTPEGVRRTAAADATAGASSGNLQYLFIGLLVLAVAWLFYRQEFSAPDEELMAAGDHELITEANEQSIAVLPFENLSADPENAYFASGIHDEILNQLSKIGGLRVISRTTMLRYADSEMPLVEIASELGVATVLEGSVQRAGDRVRITTQLIDATTDAHLWSESYDRNLEDIFAIQTDVATRIAASLEVEMGSEVQQRIARVPTENLEAYRLLLLADSQWTNLTPGGFQRAIGYLEEAIALDPNFAKAYSHLAAVLVISGSLDAGATGEGFMVQAKAYADKALSIDPDLADAYWTLGIYYRTMGDWAASEAANIRSVELDPGSRFSQIGYALLLSGLSRNEEAIEHIEVALALDPLSADVHRVAGEIYMAAGDGERGLTEFETASALSPSSPLIKLELAFIQQLTGRTEAAKQSLAELQALETAQSDYFRLAAMAPLYAIMGMEEETDESLQWLLANDPLSSGIPRIYVARGDLDTAVDYIEARYRKTGTVEYNVRSSPLLRLLWGHPRYEALMDEVGLTAEEG